MPRLVCAFFSSWTLVLLSPSGNCQQRCCELCVTEAFVCVFSQVVETTSADDIVEGFSDLWAFFKKEKSLNTRIFCYKVERGRNAVWWEVWVPLTVLACVKAEMGEAGVVEGLGLCLLRASRVPSAGTDGCPALSLKVPPDLFGLL